MCDSYPVLIAHFEDMASVERFPKPSAAVLCRAKQVLSCLKRCDHLLFLHFMCDDFNHLATLRKFFQKDDPTVFRGVESQEACFWELTSSRVDMDPQMAKVNQAIKETAVYKGVRFQNPTHNTLEAERIEVIRKKKLCVCDLD